MTAGMARISIGQMKASRFLQKGTRPTSIRWFERLLLTALAIDLANNLGQWSNFSTGLAARAIPSNPLLVLALCVLSPVLGLILWYFVAQRASNLARWIVTILVLVGAIGFAAKGAAEGPAVAMQPMFVVAAFAASLKLLAVRFLFTVSAAAWFAAHRRPA